jgi:hypothetical protein
MGTRRQNPQFFTPQIQIPIPNKYLGCGYKDLVFCRNNDGIIENMDKGLNKWVLIVWPEMSQMPQNLSAQFVCPSSKLLDFNEKRLHWPSIVRGRARVGKKLLSDGPKRLSYFTFTDKAIVEFQFLIYFCNFCT